MYTTFYGLRLKPFENTPDTRFLFPSKSHREILASLRYGVENSKGFILIAGDIGTGKTTMIYALLKGIDPAYIIFNIFNPKWTFDQIIRYLAIKLGVNVERKDNFQILDGLQTRIEKLDYQGKRVVLIIDEAHLLSESTLEDIRLISNIEKENKKLIQIVLVGQKEIYQALQKDSLKTLKQRILINRELKPLGQAETRHYIRHRLNVAGTNTNLFDTRALALIWRKSGGTPRIINHICDNALLIGLAEEKQTIGAKIIKEVVKDMETGHKQPRFHFRFPYFRFKWLVGTAAIVALLTFLFAQNFSIRRIVSPKKILQETQISPNQPIATVIKGSIETNAPNYEPEYGKSDNNAIELLPEKNSKLEVIEIKEIEKAPIDLNGKILTNSSLKPEDTAGIQQIAHEPAEKVRKAEFREKVVRPDENLWEIVKEEYGVSNNTLVDIVHMANPAIKNVNRIFIGQQISLPLLRREDLIKSDESGSYKIHIASFYNLDLARKYRQELVNESIKSSITPTRHQENEVYRIYCGMFNSRDEARKELKTMKLKYLSFIN